MNGCWLNIGSITWRFMDVAAVGSLSRFFSGSLPEPFLRASARFFEGSLTSSFRSFHHLLGFFSIISSRPFSWVVWQSWIFLFWCFSRYLNRLKNEYFHVVVHCSLSIGNKSTLIQIIAIDLVLRRRNMSTPMAIEISDILQRFCYDWIYNLVANCQHFSVS